MLCFQHILEIFPYQNICIYHVLFKAAYHSIDWICYNLISLFCFEEYLVVSKLWYFKEWCSEQSSAFVCSHDQVYLGDKVLEVEFFGSEVIVFNFDKSCRIVLPKESTIHVK